MGERGVFHRHQPECHKCGIDGQQRDSLPGFGRMKHSKLHGVAHNFAAGLAGGFSFVVAGYVIRATVFAEAAATPDGVLVLDFLSGMVTGAGSGGNLEFAAGLNKAAFPAFCAKHRVDHSDCRVCVVRFISSYTGNGFVITVEDRNGRRTSRE